MKRLLALALLVGTFPASSVADPTPFASVSVTCDPEFPSNYATTAQATAHPHVIGRLTIPDGPGWWSPAGAPYLHFSGVGTMWQEHGSIAAGGMSTGVVLCPRVLTYEVAFFDVPTTPATFTGVTSPGSDPSRLIFRAPAVAQYAADLVLQQGGVELASGAQRESFTATGRFELGTLRWREHADRERAAGPGLPGRSHSSITGDDRGSRFDVRGPSRRAHDAEYVLRSTAVTARIQNVSGDVVRTLAESTPLGRHSLVWDGLDAVGRPARDGLYRCGSTRRSRWRRTPRRS